MDLHAGPARARFDLASGARLASLSLAGHELLVGPNDDPMRWGSYPMAPWAGRVRGGRFTFDGVEHQLPVDVAPPHAIHGTAYDVPWSPGGGEPDLVPAGAGDPAAVMVLELDGRWPFPARVEQQVQLSSDRLRMELRLRSLAPPGGPDMPAMVGWHPWFRRTVGGAAATLQLDAGAMYELDDEAIPTGRLVPPVPPPWDNCFTAVARGPDLIWPGVVELALRSSCDHWVVYTPDHAICVEPQTGAPDAFNRQPHRLGPGEALDAWFELSWRLP